MGVDFIDNDEDQDGEYYGKVKKQGEVGLVIKTDPSKVDKIRLVIGQSMDSETNDMGTEEQKVDGHFNNVLKSESGSKNFKRIYNVRLL